MRFRIRSGLPHFLPSESAMPPKTYDQQIQIVSEALNAGKLQAAAASVQEIMGQVESLETLGDGLGKVLQSIYEEFQIPQFLAFAAWLERHPAEEMAQRALLPVASYREGIKEWRALLLDIAAESRSRQLAAQVQLRDVAAAANVAQSMFDRGENPETRLRVARQIGAVLGSLSHDQDRADQVVQILKRNASAIGIGDAHIAALEEARRTTFTNQAASGFSQQGRAFSQLHTEAVVQLMRALPGRAAGSQPTSDDEVKFYNALHLLLAAYFADEKAIPFLDIARILQEFCPTDPRATGPVEGIEELAFLRMNPVDRVVSVRALRRLGQKEKPINALIAAAKQHKEGKPAEIILNVMGGFANSRFFPYLASALNDKRYARMVPSIIDSLGRIGDKQSLDTLMAMFEQCCRSKPVDPSVQRIIAILIAALGRIARHPSTSNEMRSAIVLKALKILPPLRPLADQALHHFFALYDPASLAPEVKAIGVRHIVDSLWTPDTRSKLARGTENQRTELGHREEPVQILVALGPEIIPVLLQESERRALQFSGAYWALGEALSQIGDERALPLLQKILINTLTFDDSKIPEHMRETYYDAAKGENVPLSRDRIAHSLCYAIQHRCGPQGAKLLMEMAQAVQNKRYAVPGPQTASLLQEVLMKTRLREEAIQRGEPGVDTDRAAEADDFDSLEALVPREEKRPRQGDADDKIIHDIRGKGLFGVKLDKRISAIQEAAARGLQEAIGPLCELLGNSDKMIGSAAEVALLEMLGQWAATPESAASRLALFDMLEILRKAPQQRAEAMVSLIARLSPDQDPFRSFLLRFVSTESDAGMKAKIARIFHIHQERNPPAKVDSHASSGMEGEGQPAEGGSAPPAVSTEHEKVALRRQYLAQRQAWIAGGKKGAEPPRPAGI